MQRGVDVGPPHRLDEGADDVVVLVTVAVVAHRGLVQGLLDRFDRQFPTRLDGLGRNLQCGQRAAGVARRQLHQQVDGLGLHGDLPAQAAGVIDGALYHRADVVGRQRAQLQDQ